MDEYPLKDLLELRKRDQDLAKRTFMDARTKHAEALEDLQQFSARAELAEDKVRLHQRQTEERLANGFTVSQSLRFAADAIAHEDRRVDATEAVAGGGRAVEDAKMALEAARESLACATQAREVIERNEGQWREHALEEAQEVETDELETFVSFRVARDRFEDD